MRFNLSLRLVREQSTVLTKNYQNLLSAAIYTIISKNDEAFARFLHNKGYSNGSRKKFKFWTFSDLQMRCNEYDDRLIIIDDRVSLSICFHISDAASHFIAGLFKDHEIVIVDKETKVVFRVEEVKMVSTEFERPDEIITVRLKPISPIATGLKKQPQNKYDYKRPSDVGFTDCLIYNLLQKTSVLYDLTRYEWDKLNSEVKMDVIFNQSFHKRVTRIRPGTTQQSTMVGYHGFELELTAPKRIITIALDSGLGVHNAQGFGCVIIPEVKNFNYAKDNRHRMADQDYRRPIRRYRGNGY